MAIKIARILSAILLDGIDYKPNQVIEADAEIIKGQVKSGTVDDSPSAVKYCVEELNAKVVQHATPASNAAVRAAAKAAMQAEIAALEKSLANAADADKTGIAAQLATKQQELAAL